MAAARGVVRGKGGEGRDAEVVQERTHADELYPFPASSLFSLPRRAPRRISSRFRVWTWQGRKTQGLLPNRAFQDPATGIASQLFFVNHFGTDFYYSASNEGRLPVAAEEIWIPKLYAGRIVEGWIAGCRELPWQPVRQFGA